MQRELPRPDGRAQVQSQSLPLESRLVHIRLEEAVGSLAFLLGAHERHIGSGQHRVVGVAIMREEGDADAATDGIPQLAVRVGAEIASMIAWAPRGSLPGGEICRQHREFVAAEARDRAARADQCLQARGDLDQQAVPGRDDRRDR